MDGLERLRADPGLRAAVETARAWGVPPSRILSGRQPAQRLIRDDLGRVVRVESEPEWTDDDRQLAVALTLHDADKCPGCGQPLSETTKPENEARYVAQQAIRCHHCAATARGAQQYADDPHPQTLLIPVEHVPAKEPTP